jgi:hypothetical protein
MIFSVLLFLYPQTVTHWWLAHARGKVLPPTKAVFTSLIGTALLGFKEVLF